MKPVKILVAEDDLHIRIGIADTLESEGYNVITAEDGNQALDAYHTTSPDLVILDIMMPGKNGYEVCREIRSKNEQVPVIMLTAKGEEIDKVMGLTLGADDYMTKPFGIHELLARIAAVLRRSRPQTPQAPSSESPFLFGSATINPRTYRLTRNNSEMALTQKDLDLIRLFNAHPGEVLSRDTILNEIWGIDYLGTTRTLDQHIAQLRKKVETDPSHPEVITTVHGVGYRYCG